MKKALALRGFYSKEGYTSGGGLPRTTYDLNFKELLPLYEKYLFPYFDDIYFVSYPDSEENNSWLINELNPVKYEFIPPDQNTQIDCFQKCLDIIPDNTYSEICITRFDLVWKMHFSDLKYNNELFNFLWKEVEWRWKDHHCVADPLHVFDGKFLKTVRDILPEYKTYARDTTLHYVWPLFSRELMTYNLGFVFNGYYNSNPADLIETGSPTPNPLYYIWRGEYRDDL
jgi:hypothetical protein